MAQRPRCGVEACRGKIILKFCSHIDPWNERVVSPQIEQSSSVLSVLKLNPWNEKVIWPLIEPFFPQVVTAFDGKSLEVEDEGGDKQIINVKDQQVDLPPLRCYSYPDIVNAIQQQFCFMISIYNR